MLEREGTIRAANVIEPAFSPPSETFVVARARHPRFERPVPVLTGQVPGSFSPPKDFVCYDQARLSVVWRKLDALGKMATGTSAYFGYVLSQLRPALVQAHFAHSVPPVLRAVRRLRLPLVVHFYGVETKRMLSDPEARRLLDAVSSVAVRITCLSNHMLEELSAAGYDTSKVRRIPLGVDTEFFAPQDRPPLDHERVRLLAVSRLHPEKGLDSLLKALSRLERIHPGKFGLRIVGSGPIGESLRSMTGPLGINESVQFLGTMSPERVRDEMGRSDVFVLPSIQETQGVVLQEAQATGLATVASRVGGVPEGTIEGVTGLLVEPNSPESLECAILTLATTEGLARRMGQEGRRFVEREFSRESEYRSLSALFDEALEEHARHHA